MSKKIIPFSWHPFTWGTTGKTRQILEAEFSLNGYDLKKRLLEIHADEFTEKELRKKLIDLDFQYNKIDKSTQLRNLVDMIEDEHQRSLAILELDFKENKITDIEYQKQIATHNKEPWVTVLSMDFGGKQALEGSFELDWNEFFVENLIKEGYSGPTDDNIVNQWFMTVCRNVAMEEFDGTGEFTSDSEANLETMKRWNSSTTQDGKTIHK